MSDDFKIAENWFPVEDGFDADEARALGAEAAADTDEGDDPFADTDAAAPLDPNIPYDGPIGRELFEVLAGTAGVGKTFEVKRYFESQPSGSVALAATTGIAAINLGDGTTLNALLGYFDTNSLKDSFIAGHLHTKLRSLRRAGLRRIVCDEVSMMDKDQLTVITRAIETVNEPRLEDGGGEGSGEIPPQIGLTLVGDFGQLPPIGEKVNGRSPKVPPYAFQSPEWAKYTEHVTKLTEVRRQDSPEFIRAIHAVRAGDVVTALAFFKDRLHDQSDNHFDGCTIVAKNDAVDRYNQIRLDELSTAPIVFRSTRWGKQRGEWKNIPEVLNLKVGALVMVLANSSRPVDDREEGGKRYYEYVNGDLGTVEAVGQKFGNPAALVNLKRGGRVAVGAVTRDTVIPLEVGRAKELKAEGKEGFIKDNKWEITGQITYMPLRCAYASTVHKSQGLSLDNVQVDLRDHFFGSPGMMFVALSRARTAEGLRIVGSPQTFAARCVVNQVVKDAGWL